MTSNICTQISIEDALSEMFHLLGQPVRIQILLTIANDEACVCHLEARLGLRQAVISQHLMVLREAGLVIARRTGRNIYYHLADPQLINIIRQVGLLVGIERQQLESFSQRPVDGCPCPACNPGKDDFVSCDTSPEIKDV